MFHVFFKFLSLTILFVCQCCFSQTETYFKKDSIETPKAGDPIRYKFPEKATNYVDSVIARYVDTSEIFIDFDSNDDIHSLGIFLRRKKTFNPNDQFDIILKSTNRYYLYKNIMIPIVLQSDHRFSFLSTVYTDGIGFLVFKSRGWVGNCEIIKSD